MSYRIDCVLGEFKMTMHISPANYNAAVTLAKLISENSAERVELLSYGSPLEYWINGTRCIE